jgi:hypothetical protein
MTRTRASAKKAGTWTITIPASIKWLNANQRMHWAPKAELTRAWRRNALLGAHLAELPKGLDRVHIVAHITKPTARQYDVHNLMPTLKACVDGLVDYGLIPDDTNNHLIGPDLRQGGKGPAAVIITISQEES